MSSGKRLKRAMRIFGDLDDFIALKGHKNRLVGRFSVNPVLGVVAFLVAFADFPFGSPERRGHFVVVHAYFGAFGRDGLSHFWRE